MKKTFVNKEKLEEIIEQYPTPFHLYDEKGIRENAREFKEAFSWNKGFKEYFAVKACPNPTILEILKEEGFGVDCSSYTELMMCEAVGFVGEEIMFSSNVTPMEDFVYANKLGAIINFDDITHIDYFKKEMPLPETVSCRFNPGGTFNMGSPEEEPFHQDDEGPVHEVTLSPFLIALTGQSPCRPLPSDAESIEVPCYTAQTFHKAFYALIKRPVRVI